MDIEHLSYPVRKKTEKILKLKRELDIKKKKLIAPTSLTVIFTCYMTFFCHRYFEFAVSAINPWSDASRKIFGQDIIVFMLFICSVFFMYNYFNSYNKVRVAFDALRNDLINNIDTKFCKCSETQKCKDEYVKTMEKYGIDLVFHTK